MNIIGLMVIVKNTELSLVSEKPTQKPQKTDQRKHFIQKYELTYSCLYTLTEYL